MENTTLVSQLNLDLIKDNFQIALIEIAGMNADDITKINELCDDWRISIDIHVTSLKLDIVGPSMPADLYREIAETFDEIFKDRSLAARSMMWYAVCADMIRYSDECVYHSKLLKNLKNLGNNEAN